MTGGTSPTPVMRELADGSVLVVESIDSRTSLVSRLLDGRCVFGQVFAAAVDEHEAQVARVVEDITADPDAFARWWLEVAS